MLNRRGPRKITNVDILNNIGPANVKIYRDDDTNEIIYELKVSDLQMNEWKEMIDCACYRKSKRWQDSGHSLQCKLDELHVMEAFLEIKPGVPLEEHDLIDELNNLIKKRKRIDDSHQEPFKSTKHFKEQVKFDDYPAGTMLNEPKLGMILFNDNH